MISRRKSLLLLSASAGCPGVASAGDADDVVPALRLALPASTSDSDKRWLRLRGFHLVFTNTTEAKVGVWRDWNSWGWFCPSITITQGDKQFLFKRAVRFWTYNFPDPFWILPGDHYLLPLNLLEKEHWEQPQDFKIDKARLATVSASFSIRPDKETKSVRLWTGTVQVSAEFHLDVTTEARLPF